MRGISRVLAAAGVAAAAVSVMAVGPASAAPASAKANCATDTDGHTWAWAVCNTTGEYRVVVDYCRANCSREYGPWVRTPDYSSVNFPSGGSIIVQAPQIR